MRDHPTRKSAWLWFAVAGAFILSAWALSVPGRIMLRGERFTLLLRGGAVRMYGPGLWHEMDRNFSTVMWRNGAEFGFMWPVIDGLSETVYGDDPGLLPVVNYEWIVRVPLWIPFVLTSFAAWYLRRRARAPAPGCCRRCGYDLRGNTTGNCPECGAIAPPSPARQV